MVKDAEVIVNGKQEHVSLSKEYEITCREKRRETIPTL